MVRRTTAEQVEIDRRKAVYYAQQDAVANPNSKMPKTKEKFAIVTGVQAAKLRRTRSFQCVMILFGLSLRRPHFALLRDGSQYRFANLGASS